MLQKAFCYDAMGRPQTSECYACFKETNKNVKKVHEVIFQDGRPRNNGIRTILGLSYGA